jgi:hypothetical protein
MRGQTGVLERKPVFDKLIESWRLLAHADRSRYPEGPAGRVLIAVACVVAAGGVTWVAFRLAGLASGLFGLAWLLALPTVAWLPVTALVLADDEDPLGAALRGLAACAVLIATAALAFTALLAACLTEAAQAQRHEAISGGSAAVLGRVAAIGLLAILLYRFTVPAILELLTPDTEGDRERSTVSSGASRERATDVGTGDAWHLPASGTHSHR